MTRHKEDGQHEQRKLHGSHGHRKLHGQHRHHKWYRQYKQSTLALLMLTLILVMLSGCASGKNSNKPNEEAQTSSPSPTMTENVQSSSPSPTMTENVPSPSPSPIVTEPEPSIYSKETNPVATIEMENGDQIHVELFPDIAPNTVRNFISLANSGFYDGVIFHRVIAGFMIQGGDPLGNGTGGPGYTIKGEFAINDFDNPIKHNRGVISMGRHGDPAYDTAGSQFFIVHEDSPHLDGLYAAFGQVVEGIAGVDNVAKVKTGPSNKPVEPQKIVSIKVDTKGVDYEAPEVIK